MGKYSWQAAEGRGQPPSPHGFGAPRKAEDSEETLEVGGALRFRLEAAAFASWLRRAKEDRGRGRFIRELEN